MISAFRAFELIQKLGPDLFFSSFLFMICSSKVLNEFEDLVLISLFCCNGRYEILNHDGLRLDEHDLSFAFEGFLV